MLKGMSVMHPAAKMLVDLSAAQDVEAGDGTTSVVVIAGSLLGAAEKLLSKGGRWRQQIRGAAKALQASTQLSLPNPFNELQRRLSRYFTTCRAPYNSLTELP